MDKKACCHHTAMGDLNAKIGIRNINENMKDIVPFGTGNRHERGERLLDFAGKKTQSGSNYGNSFFQREANRYWTWEAPGGMIKNQTDFILSSDRKMVGNCGVKTKVDIGSDH